ncbi:MULTISPECIES: hypothetical protein [unclassified Microcoleus]|uniref:hypothetical protein n=1 Tax=unclassified Microcoleus TaxID=2642155 RepID=UPI001D4CA26D|nr:MULTISPECIES: hypothetical protein [unclassified Microcoleus]MCC3473990.1 hypothetical protein [Microcoleus sp. PH2017_13_LAR_U_A]MCC3486072.1 hypothetical protein [Microcoleus sp. PH2017_14_LAR_D_A]MCC3598604.1 hypothetical protein [Microcoleus sp. PH2017_26_ELK_O_A]MCC3623914.1 hypothetical protein [Microcoleus sp. PH2017_36_ELK_O_B]
MTTTTPEIRMAQLFKQRLDFFESRMSALEFQIRQSADNTEFSQQFEALILEMQALNSPEISPITP